MVPKTSFQKFYCGCYYFQPKLLYGFENYSSDSVAICTQRSHWSTGLIIWGWSGCSLFTARVRSTTRGYIFSLFFSSLGRGGGNRYSLAVLSDRYPLVSGPSSFLGVGENGTPGILPSSLHARGRTGVPLSPPPSCRVPPSLQTEHTTDRMRHWWYDSCIFTQEDFLIQIEILADTGPFCGDTGTDFLDFWGHLSWISKSVWIPCLHVSLPIHIPVHTSTSIGETRNKDWLYGTVFAPTFKPPRHSS